MPDLLLPYVCSMVIAATEEVAIKLMREHRQSSVTMAGSISRPGMLQGGWQPASRDGKMAKKLRYDVLQVELAVQHHMLGILASEVKPSSKPAC